MFKKKPQIKPSAPIRSSDRRKFAQSIIDEFGLTPPPSEDRDAVVTALRSSLLPENTTSAKFLQRLGPGLDPVNGIVYSGSHPGEQQRPLWVKIDHGALFPTVYTVWKNPTVVPLLHTHPPVMEKLSAGADLMTPGLIGPPFPKGATKGRLVAIASSAKPTVALAVGLAEIDVAALQKVAGEKGKAVRILHWYGDELGGSSGEAPEKVDGPGLLDDGQEGMEGEGAGGVSLEGLSIEDEGEKDGGEGKTETVADKAPDRPVERELTTQEIDAVFHSAALYGLHHHLSNTSLNFPITQSAFISQLLLPFLPPASQFSETGSMSAVHPSLQLKKTSWKTAAKFLKQLDKDQILKTKTRDGSEVVVMDIDWKDERITSFVPYKLPIAAPSGSSVSGSNSAAPTGPLKVLELYRATSKLYPILEAVKANTKEIYPANELRSLFSAYLDAETEPNPRNKRLVKLNPVVSNTILNPSVPEDSTILKQGFGKRDVLTQNFVKACSPYYAVLRPGETYPGDVKATSGAPPKVTVTIERKRGKTMTRLSGLEAFRIDPHALGEELRVLCASSASVSQLTGSSPKHPVMEIMVQGQQDKAVRRTLEERGVPGRCIVLVDNINNKKGK